MVLISITQFEAKLICPKCRSALNKNNDNYHCTNQNCEYSEKLKFPIVGQNPVLVDFEQSILNESDLLKT
ncbi:MAG: hypothetical protein MUD14_29080, partial [Hydrococcus sp. Prado102]|nr:hypothetical protein [Hydrococcus sp. Prado102]